MDPLLVESLMLDNDRVVYFREIPADRWPEASTGVRLIPRHSVAVDPKIIPLGSMVRVDRADGEVMIAMAVDTGGAIRERRIDLFLGVGDEAMAEAGGVVESVRVSIIEPVDRAPRDRHPSSDQQVLDHGDRAGQHDSSDRGHRDGDADQDHDLGAEDESDPETGGSDEVHGLDLDRTDADGEREYHDHQQQGRHRHDPEHRHEDPSNPKDLDQKPVHDLGRPNQLHRKQSGIRPPHQDGLRTFVVGHEDRRGHRAILPLAVEVEARPVLIGDLDELAHLGTDDHDVVGPTHHQFGIGLLVDLVVSVGETLHDPGGGR
ncbi:MAG: hypothetical protein CMJ34_03935 [Phycisphaerae bacterium]|nr:hypothetical protein [Phycisphaerae bacterium]